MPVIYCFWTRFYWGFNIILSRREGFWFYKRWDTNFPPQINKLNISCLSEEAVLLFSKSDMYKKIGNELLRSPISASRVAHKTNKKYFENPQLPSNVGNLTWKVLLLLWQLKLLKTLMSKVAEAAIIFEGLILWYLILYYAYLFSEPFKLNTISAFYLNYDLWITAANNSLLLFCAPNPTLFLKLTKCFYDIRKFTHAV